MALHGPPPHIRCVITSLAPEFAADRRRVQEQVRPLQRHGSCGLGEPLVPADPHPDAAVASPPGLEPGVARVEVELLLVARPVRDVRLAVDPEHDAVFDDRHRIEVGRSGCLEERNRHDGPRTGRDLAHGRYCQIVARRRRPREVLLVLALGEVASLEQLRWQDDVSARPNGIGDGGDCSLPVVVAVGPELPLDHRNRHFVSHLPMCTSTAADRAPSME